MFPYLLRNIFLKTLRDNLKGIFGWGTALMLLMIVGASQYPQIVGPVGPERERNVEQLTQTLRAFSFMTGEVTAVGTLGGFATARLLGILPLLLSLWAIVVGVGLIRGEEQAGSLEVLLSTPQRRISVFAEKALALLVSVVALLTLAGAGLWIGSLLANETLPIDALALAMLNAMPLVALWGVLGLLAGQLSGTSRKASAAVVALLFATYLLNNIFNTIPNLGGFGWFMPFRYYTESKPLVPGETFEWSLWLVLVIATIVAATGAALLFARRDLGAPVRLMSGLAGRTGRASRSSHPGTASSMANGNSLILLGSVLGKSLRDLTGVTIAWSLGLSLYAAVIISTTEQILGPMRAIARSGGMLGALFGELASTEAFLAVALFINLPLFATIYSIVQIESWASDEEEGQLGMLLSTPVTRERVLISRYVATFVGLLFILAITGIVIVLSASLANVALEYTRVWGSLLALVPLVMLVCAFGLCAATWLSRPSIAVPLTIAIVAAMFLLEVFGPLFRWPEAIRNLSIFHLYGRPLVEGIAWFGVSTLTLALLLFGASSLIGFRRRDLAR